MTIPLSVLMVEDSVDETELVIQELRLGGYYVTSERVDTPQTMNAALENRSWDVVICDFSLLYFDGDHALRLLRERNRRTPFIYISDSLGEEIAVQALKQGADDYVTKGNLKRLRSAIQRELKEAEQRQEKAERELRRRHQERFEAIGRLAGGVAHDFNNLIGAILGWAELGENEAQNNSGLQNRFKQIAGQAERAAGLTSQLLAFASRRVLQPVKLDVNRCISEMRGFLESGMRQDIEFKVILDPHLDIIYGDGSQVDQITMNLALNARDAMPMGGSLIIETHNVNIDKEFCRRNADCRPGRHVMLVVSDTGVGMNSATVDHVFEPFFTTKNIGKGAGLGLATVYGIVKQHAGFLDVISEVGKGTTFRVYIPSTVGPLNDPQPDIGKVSLTGNETILVAEGHEGIRASTNEILSSHGYSIILAADGVEALRLFRQDPSKIDLALLDVAVPRLSGIDVFMQMNAVSPDLAVVFTSGHTSESASWNSRVLAGAAFLQKPYASKALCLMVRNTLDCRRPPSSKSALANANGDFGAWAGIDDRANSSTRFRRQLPPQEKP
jgi:two-component system, cell cycle sensor histidine kinase and response regulator CckA